MSNSTRYSLNELLQQLRECQERYGKVTPRIFNEDEDFASAGTISRRFGSWMNGKKEANIIDEDEQPSVYSDEQILEKLRQTKEEHGEVSPRTFRKDPDNPSPSTVLRRLGSWSGAKNEAGIDEDLSSNTGRKPLDTSQILSDLRELKEREGKVTAKLLDQHNDLVGSSAVIDRFDDGRDDTPGGWIEAKRQAGLEPDERKSNARPRKFSDGELLEFLRQCKEEEGKVTQRIFDANDEFPSSGAIRKRFGSWNKGKELAGIDDSTERYTDEELLEMLRTCAERYGRCTAQLFAGDDDFCSPETLQRRFGSWSEAKKQAGVQ